MSDLYTKVGRRYVRLGSEFRGFPLEGVWLVQKKPGHYSEQHIMHVGDLPSPYPLANLHCHRDRIGKAVADILHSEKPYSADTIVQAIFRVVAKVENEEKFQAGAKL